MLLPVEVVGDERFDRIVDQTGALPVEVSFERLDGPTISRTEIDGPWVTTEQQSTSGFKSKVLGMEEPVLGAAAPELAESVLSISTLNP